MTTRNVALITGGTRGIGAGIAERLAIDGFDLMLAGLRSEEEVDSFLTALEQRGATVRYLRADVSSRDDREALLQATQEAFGRLDVLVNNAGMAPRRRADILEADEASFEELIRTNLQGPYFLTQSAAQWMIRQQAVSRRHRAIIHVGSVSAEVASVNRGDYCISKAGIAMASHLWAVRLAEHGISVYEVRPGIIATDMTSAVKEKYDRLIQEGLLLEARWGTPEDIGRAVSVLARGEIPYATGSVLHLDGGLTVPRL
ncbi:3-ketoacyl-ACP reductase [Terriglobus sp. 2YAB30_2]|uniref:3-ketoacyl-ACP reductase n=1 Tax=unclassified Terriglobus TaxID=2628988 RepID=UPI003F9E6B96